MRARYIKNVKNYVNFVQMLLLLNILANVVASSLFFHSLPTESTGVTIRTVCQDQKGNMWFGGTDGITRYDGSRYTDFRYSADDVVNGDHIYHLICDREGTVWAASIEGISAFDPASGTFQTWPSPDGTVKSMLPLSGKKLLIAVDGRLWVFDAERKSYTREDIPPMLRDLRVSVLYSPGDSIIFAGGLDGRVLELSRELHIKREFTPVNSSAQINSILLDDDGSLLVATEGSGLWSVSKDGATARLGLEYVRTLCKDKDGVLWVGTKNGLNVLRDGRFDEYHYDFYDKGSITHDSVLSIFCDQQGTMWLGTFYGGVCYCTSRPSLFAATVSRPGESYLNGNVISDIVEAPDGTLWIGTNSGGLNHLLKDGSFEHIKGLGDGYSDQPDIKCIFISKKSGNIIVAADKGDLSVLRPGSKRLQAKGSDFKDGSYGVLERKDGELFVGTPNGLFLYNESSGKTSHIQLPGTSSDITTLELAGDGTLWVGRKFGVVAIDANSCDIIDLPSELSDLRYVEDFLEDSSGRIWMSSRAGLFCYDNGSISAYTVKEGLPDNVVRGVEEDAAGRLWISTNNGLCRLDPATGEKWIFTMADGLPGDRFTPYAHCRTSSGEMVFGGMSWLVRFNPEIVNISYKEVAPVISGIEVKGQLRQYNGGQVDLRPGDGNIGILFSAPDYISGHNGRFFYKLEGPGVNDDWHEAGADRTASFSGLGSGKYTFLLEYSNSAGIRSAETVELHFNIPPYWYERPLVRILAALLLLVVAVLFVLRLFARTKAKYQSEMERVRNELLNDFSLEFVKIGANKSSDNESSVAKVFYKGDEEFMRKAMQVVKKHLEDTEFSVEKLAEEMNMSRSNLHLRSKALFGVSAHEFIKTVRFNEACRMLMEKKYSVAEIGYMVGFATPSYFASAFHKFMGCTPTEYVKRNSPV